MSQDQQSMAENMTAEEGTSTPTQDEAAEKKPVRRRTTRVKKAEDGAPVEQSAADASERAASQAAEAVAELAAPKRRGRPRKTSSVEAAGSETVASDASAQPSAAQAAESTAAATAEGVAPAPKRRGRPRKTASGEAAASAAEAAVSGETAASAVSDDAHAGSASDAEPAPAPKRRGRPRKVVAPAADGEAGAAGTPAATGVETSSSDVSESAAAASEGAPAPKRRGRPRKADAAAQPADAAAEATASDTANATPAGTASESEEGKGTSAADGARMSRERDGKYAKDGTRKVEREGREGGSSRDHGDRSDRNAHNDRANRDRNGKNGNGKNNDRSNRDRNDRNNRDDRRQRRQRDNRNNREVVPSVNKEELAALKVADLRAKAAELGIDAAGIKKAELVDIVYDAAVKAEGFIEVTGVLDILADGYGFLRASGYLPGEGDAYMSTSTIRRNGLRKGDMVTGQTRPARDNEKFAAIQKVISVNGVPIEELGARPKFSELTPVFPDDRLLMEHGKNTITARVIDLAAPIGKGQRGLIVSPPKAGKTTVLKDIAASITANNPEVHLMYLGIDERPEEATDMERSIRGEVVSSTFDMPCENHIAVAELVIERAKRLVEMGRDVVILLDSITRLARAYNLAQPASGRILSGGVDSTALYPPKRFLGAARNIEGGGSLTILASALIDTGSKMDEVIFEEFKGTGNMELKLDRNLADRRIFPAIDPVTSGTRKEELLLDPQEAPLIWAVRRILANMNNTERAMDMLIKSLKQTDTNQEFLIRTAKKAQGSHGKSDDNFEF